MGTDQGKAAQARDKAKKQRKYQAEDKKSLADYAKTESENRKNTAKSPDDIKAATDTQTKADVASKNIETSKSKAVEGIKKIQTEIDSAYEAFYKADLVADSVMAARKIDEDGSETKKKAEEIKLEADKVKKEAEGAQRIANSFSTIPAKISSAKDALVKAKNIQSKARNLEFEAQEYQNWAAKIKEAADKISPTTLKATTAKDKAGQAESIFKELLSTTTGTEGDITTSLKKANDAVEKSSKALAPLLAAETETKAKNMAVLVVQKVVKELQEAADQEYLVNMQQIEKEEEEAGVRTQQQLLQQEAPKLQ
uniref:Uncharacterized protein n=1 Tax=Ditylenchus dipsaci TaxID=166011 RepID=A0A915EAZ4_9BILA